MERQQFGTTGISVSQIGIGCSRIGGVAPTGASRGEEIAMLQEAVDAGINFFDTADVYSQGQSEILLGRALRGRRSEVVIATKGGYVVSSSRRLLARVKPLARPLLRSLRIRRPPPALAQAGRQMEQDFSPAHLVSAVDASLRRLGTDYIDVYQLHSPDRTAVDGGDFLDVLLKLREQGKIRSFGLAADDPDDVVGFDAHDGIASLQVPFNLVYQDARDVLFPKAMAHGTGVIARSCYAAGLFREDVPESTLRTLDPNWPRFLWARAVSKELGRPLLETALQFSLAVRPISVTIVGMRTRAHLHENLRFLSAPRLSADEVATLGRAWSTT